RIRGGSLFYTNPIHQYPTFCTKFGLMFNSVTGMGKILRVGSLLVLKIQESSHLPKRIRSSSRATPVCVPTDCLRERHLTCNLLIPRIRHQIGVDVQLCGGDGEDPSGGIAIGLEGPSVFPLAKADQVVSSPAFSCHFAGSLTE